MNKSLYKLRKSNLLSQNELSKRLKVSAPTYINVELGKKPGSIDMWRSIQIEFNIKDEDMWKLIKGE